MLRWISKSGTLIQFAIFAGLALWLWVPAFMNPVNPVYTTDDGPLFALLYSWIQQLPLLTVGLVLILIVLQSVLLFYTFQANGFFGRANFIPAIIVLLAFSWNRNFQTMHALVPASVCVIIAINSILGMYGKQNAYHQVFTASFSVSIAALFYLPLVYLLLLLWLSLVSYRISSWREYVITLIGFVLPWIYYAVALFWNDNLLTGLKQISDSLFNLVLPPNLSTVNVVWLLVSVFVLVVTMIAVLNAVTDKLISLRRRAWVMFALCVSSLIVVLLSGWPVLSANYLFVIPLSFFITGSISMIKRPFFFEMLALAYFLLFIGMRFYVGI